MYWKEAIPNCFSFLLKFPKFWGFREFSCWNGRVSIEIWSCFRSKKIIWIQICNFRPQKTIEFLISWQIQDTFWFGKFYNRFKLQGMLKFHNFLKFRVNSQILIVLSLIFLIYSDLNDFCCHPTCPNFDFKSQISSQKFDRGASFVKKGFKRFREMRFSIWGFGSFTIAYKLKLFSSSSWSFLECPLTIIIEKTTDAILQFFSCFFIQFSPLYYTFLILQHNRIENKIKWKNGQWTVKRFSTHFYIQASAFFRIYEPWDFSKNF